MKCRLTLIVKAGARHTEFAAQVGDSWSLRVAAPPVNGKANKEIIRFLADLAEVLRRHVRIVVGEANSLKIVEIVGIDAAALERAIFLSQRSQTIERAP